jgi:copper chaperone CopZ
VQWGFQEEPSQFNESFLVALENKGEHMHYLVTLQGLHCEACKKITEKRIGKIEGVSSTITDLANQTVSVQANRALTLQDVEEVLKDTEYKVTAFTEI